MNLLPQKSGLSQKASMPTLLRAQSCRNFWAALSCTLDELYITPKHNWGLVLAHGWQTEDSLKD
jgi:hypothetical protein